MTLNIWDYDREDALLEKYEHHREFVVGVDFNLENPDQIATCSWDETVYVWNRGEEPIPTHDEDEEDDEEEDEFKQNFRRTLGLEPREDDDDEDEEEEEEDDVDDEDSI
jgi:peroxin-7